MKDGVPSLPLMMDIVLPLATIQQVFTSNDRQHVYRLLDTRLPLRVLRYVDLQGIFIRNKVMPLHYKEFAQALEHLLSFKIQGWAIC